MTVNAALFLLVNGLVNGAVYALLGLGLVLIYNVTRVINVAQGEFLMLGALTAIGFANGGPIGGAYLAASGAGLWILWEVCSRRIWWLIPVGPAVGVVLWWLIARFAPFHLPPLAAAVVATMIIAFLGAATYRIFIQPVAWASELVFLIIAVAIFLGYEGLGLLFWGPSSFDFPVIRSGNVVLGAMRVSFQGLLVIGTTLMLLFLVWLLLEHTLLGKALRASAMNRLGARLSGVSPVKAGLVAFSVSAGLAAIAGILIAPISYATYNMGLSLALKGFVGVVIGGMSSYVYAVLGGLAVGVIEAFAFYSLSAYGEAIVYALIIVILLFQTLTQSRGRVA